VAVIPERELAEFAASIDLARVPTAVVEGAKSLMIDWFGSALAGKDSPQVNAFTHFAEVMGPDSGSCDVLPAGTTTSALFAALINGASSHVAEQDDVHNGSVFHPGTVVFPAALAAAQQENVSGAEFLAGVIAGYEVGIRVGEFLGRSHYKIFHTTGTAGTIAAAAAVGRVLALDADQMQHAFGSAGTQAAGLWEFLRDAADSKQLHTAKAAADGLLAAYLARDGFTGAKAILTGRQGMAAGMSRDADESKLADRLGERWATLETSYKWHASCRHTHPAADALMSVMERERVAWTDVASIEARVHQGAIDVLGQVQRPSSVHQAKFSMGTVLALIAVHGAAGLSEFENGALTDQRVTQLRDRVTMVLDPEVDAAYPRRWIGKVVVSTTDGRRLEGRVDVPKGDPGNGLSRREIEEKAVRLAVYRGAMTKDEAGDVIRRIWRIDEARRVRGLSKSADTSTGR